MPVDYAQTRSDNRIPRLRSRGRKNRRRLLDEADAILKSGNGDQLRFSDVFKAAGVSRGSAYRIYDSIDDLLQDLACVWISNFAVHINESMTDYEPENWQALADRIVEQSAAYWMETLEIQRTLPRVRFNVPATYKEAVREATWAFSRLFERHFCLPHIQNWLSVICMFLQIGDTVFADAVRRDGRISTARLLEAQLLCRTYLSTHLPEVLPRNEP